MQSNMVRLVTLDLILWLFRRRVVNVALVLHVLPMHLDDRAGHPPCFRIPCNVAPDSEFMSSHLVHRWFGSDSTVVRTVTCRSI